MNVIEKTISLVTRPFLLKPRLEVSQPGEYARGFKEVDLAYCKTYHESFESRPGRKMMWQFEKAFLKDFVKTKLPRTYLDFAGGTGRVAKLMEENTKANQYILDTSTLMLEVARSHLSKTCILNADFKDDPSELEGVRFDLITAFRFFPNAEPPLRDAAMNFISTKMESGGFLICNNHRNFWSIPYTLSRLTFQGGDKGMLNSELTTLAEKNGFELVKVFSIGKLPQNEFNTIMPWHWLRWIEHKLLSCCTILGYNTIFVFRKI